MASKTLQASWLTVALLLGPLSILGELIITRTHHRPLGAATFVTLALLLWFAAELLNHRVLDPHLSSGRATARRVLWWLGSGLSGLVLLRALL